LPEHIVPKKIYYGVCATLLVLTFSTYRIALVDLGRWNVVVALTIAFSKATLVAPFFMHARYSPRRTQVVVLAGDTRFEELLHRCCSP
jgi:cytochrome c oxidase subunit 4